MDDEGQQVQSVSSLTLDLPPSCVEFCPAFPSYFVVGTYCLEDRDAGQDGADPDISAGEDGQQKLPKQPQSRNGSIIAFRLSGEIVTHVQTVPQPSALLDLRFSPHHGSQDLCAAVSSTATLTLFRLCPEEPQPLKHLNTMDVTAMSRGRIEPAAGEEILFLSFAWHPFRADMIALSTSTGHVYFVRLPRFDGDWELHPDPVITHMLEAWCVTISHSPASAGQSADAQATGEVRCRVYSGGDDSMLRRRTCSWHDGELAESPSALESRGHGAGVTAILPLFEQEDGHELVITGSYDEHIRLFSVPFSGRPKILSERCLGGGVWRLTLIDLEKGSGEDQGWRALILASCMHAGARIVELLKLDGGEYRFRILARFEEHKSMNYASDFQPARSDKLSVVSTSFYDRLLCLWEFRIE